MNPAPRRVRTVLLVAASALAALALAAAQPALPSPPADTPDSWRLHPVWHDGLVEKATYDASRVIYGEPRKYRAVFFTNKEQHDRRTWTKADKSDRTVEVFKHNQVEDVPTPNYTYHFLTTSHFTVEGLLLTRFDQSSQEFCGTSFRSLMPSGETPGNNYALSTFSYMPESGRDGADLRASKERKFVPEDALPLVLRDFPFGQGQTWKLQMLPTQKSNRAAPLQPIDAEIRDAGEEDGLHKLELVVPKKAEKNKPAEAPLRGTFFFAPDRQHVMVRYRSADGSVSYDLVSHERVDYWTIRK